MLSDEEKEKVKNLIQENAKVETEKVKSSTKKKTINISADKNIGNQTDGSQLNENLIIIIDIGVFVGISDS